MITPIQFIAFYALVVALSFLAGYYTGQFRAQSKSEKMQKWWQDREERIAQRRVRI
jgi:prolipoprotein diacylglyceryltransferase